MKTIKIKIETRPSLLNGYNPPRNPAIMEFAFLTVIGLLIGHLIRCEHCRNPLNETAVNTWAILSIAGLIYTNMIPLFYFMNMVTIGWVACDYTLDEFNFNRRT